MIKVDAYLLIFIRLNNNRFVSKNIRWFIKVDAYLLIFLRLNNNWFVYKNIHWIMNLDVVVAIISENNYIYGLM